MAFSRFVIEHEGYLINTVTLTRLPKDAPDTELQRHYFLEGQETDAIHHVILSKPNRLTLQVIPTWECNLRCLHCFSHRRLSKGSIPIDIDRTVSFINRYAAYYEGIKRLNINFLGGEPTLQSNHNAKLIDAIKNGTSIPNTKFTAASNLVKDLDDDDIEFIRRLTVLQISLDGPERSHNAQRLSSRYNNPHSRTLANIKKLVDAGLKNFQVAAAININTATKTDKVEFYRDLLSIGVSFNNIAYGHHFPSNVSTEAVNGRNIITMPGPCCVFQHMKWFSVENGDKLVANLYHGTGELGILDTPIEEVERRHKEFILATMPILNDPVCSKCPVLGQCWGGCIASHYSESPSKWCNQATYGEAEGLQQYIIKNINTWLRSDHGCNS